MKYLSILLVALVIGCASAPAPAPAPAGDGFTGAASPRAAVDAFMASMRDQDIQATAAVWGTERGAARDVLPDRSQLEKRVLVMHCYLAHDRFSVLNDASSGPRSRLFRLAVVRGNMTRETTMRAVEGPRTRWYIETVDLEPLHDLCRG